MESHSPLPSAVPGSLASHSAQTPGPGAKAVGVDAGKEASAALREAEHCQGLPMVMHCPLESPEEGWEGFTGTDRYVREKFRARVRTVQEGHLKPLKTRVLGKEWLLSREAGDSAHGLGSQHSIIILLFFMYLTWKAFHADRVLFPAGT